MAYYKAYIDRPQYGGLTQYKIETPTATYTFTDRARYNSMIEYLENGLKVIRKDQRNTYFNNGARLIDTTLKEGAEKTYTLILDGKHYTAPKYIKKYLALI